MISFPSEKKCAACGETSTYGRMGHRMPQEDVWGCGLDGRPSYAVEPAPGMSRLTADAIMLSRECALEECPHCGHVAPNVSRAYPRMDDAKQARLANRALAEHDEAAQQYLAVAELFRDADSREEGLWLLRAAWADEAAGLAEPARALRLRAGTLLEDALYQGYAINTNRGGSSLMLCETFRVGGDAARAREHCLRGTAAAPPTGLVRSLLLFEMHLILLESREPCTRAEARDRSKAEARRKELVLHIAEGPPPAPIVLRPWRAIEWSTGSLEWAGVFAQDFLDETLLVDLLRHQRSGVWQGVMARPELLPALLAATDHAEQQVRESALSALENKTLSNNQRTVHESPFDECRLRDHPNAVEALLRRLEDDDAKRVCVAGAIVKQVLYLEPAFLGRAIEVARRALPKWTADLSVTGVLERLIELRVE